MPEKIAFLFLTRGEVNNVHVWERFFQNADDSKYRIVIHAKNPTALTSPIWTSRNSAILKPIPTAWGTISLVKATIYLLQTAISDPSVTKFMLLSEFCLPTTNFDKIYNNLIKEIARSRIHWGLGKNMDRYGIIKSYLNMPAHNWAKQSQWMCLDRKHIIALLSPINTNILNQQLKDYMYCPAPDEHFFINMFLYVIRINSNEIINHPITFVDWSNNSKHPVTFNTIIKDVVEICRKNKIFFARKFLPMNLTTEDIDYLLELNIEKSTNNNSSVLEETINISSQPQIEPETYPSNDYSEQVPLHTEILVKQTDNYDSDVIINSQSISTTQNVLDETTFTQTTTVPAEYTELRVTDKQKQAILQFFMDVLNNLSTEKIKTIHSALFEQPEEPEEPDEEIVYQNELLEVKMVCNIDIEPIFTDKMDDLHFEDNPLNILSLAIEKIENNSYNNSQYMNYLENVA